MSSKILVLIAVCLLNVHLGSAASCHVPVTTPASCQPPVTTPACQVPVTYPPTTTQAPVTYPPTTTPGCVAPVTYPPITTQAPVTYPPITTQAPVTTTPGCVEPVTFPPQITTFPPVTYAPPVVVVTTPEPECIAPTTVAANTADKVVIVTNKGGYTAALSLSYLDPLTNEPVTQTGSITSGQSYAFYVPGAVDYNSELGARLNVFAVAGKQVIENFKVHGAQQCVHVWGTTLFPAWSSVDC